MWPPVLIEWALLAVAVALVAPNHLAAVPAPDGGIAGVVALEDVLERLVGHLSDAAAEPVAPGHGA